ncbi:c1-like domain-containing protein [Pochonia chlamydosporia 170]|uniref:C1-like domain-containing protein n=1 Tax=Pochonia chlamydosporia 170 TaxID=1380566 RepID=A0A179FIY9_METCM|nr:c1-like domain-containing protein [Pochonia chlamydosporia 170]OAQ65221.1 c1-like domain-containing protein [Pochonia chlamydosporia 170]
MSLAPEYYKRACKLPLRTKEAQLLVIPLGHCYACSDEINGDYYHCSICDYSSYDICAPCVGAGRHCMHQNHWLIKRNTEQDNTNGFPTEILKTQWSLRQVKGAQGPEKDDAISHATIQSRHRKKSYPRSLRQPPFDYCYQCRVTFRSDRPPQQHELELHDTLDRPVTKDSSVEQRRPTESTQRWVRNVDPEVQKKHEMKMKEMERTMDLVFQGKITEKEERLKRTEQQLYDLHHEMKEIMAKQRHDIEEAKRRLQSRNMSAPPKRWVFWRAWAN